MKKFYLKLVSLLLIFALLFSSGVEAIAATYIATKNDVSNSYKKSEFYSNFSSVKLTGDDRSDVLAIALSQLGYHEGEKKNDFDGSVGAMENYTEFNWNMGDFGVGYGGDGYPWCASFVSFCLLQSGCTDQKSMSDWCRYHEGDKKYIWREVSCVKWANQLRNSGYFKNSAAYKGNYTPLPADLIFFTENKSTESHVGFVLYTDSKKVYTIEGNAKLNREDEDSSGVYIKSYSLSDSKIRGYGALPYKINHSVTGIDYSGVRVTPGLYVSDADKNVYGDKGSIEKTNALPKYKMFEVTEITDSGRMKIQFDNNGESIEGYIDNDSQRVYQLCSYKNNGECASVTRLDEYVSHSITSYNIKGVTVAEKPGKISIDKGDSIGISGNLELSKAVTKVGYYFDNDVNNVVFNSGGYSSKTKKFTLSADTSKISDGAHTLHFVVVLENGKMAYIDLFKVDARAVVSIEVTSLPLKTQYVQGDEFCADGLEVVAHYDDGTAGIIWDYVLSGYSFAAGQHTVTAEYKGVTAQFDVTVVAMEKPEVTADNTTKGVLLNWNAIAGAQKYFVYRREYTNGKFTKWERIKVLSACSYLDGAAVFGKQYSYTVRAINGSEKSDFVAIDSVWRLENPKVVSENSAKGVKVSWGKVESAKSYYVYRRKYSNGKWETWERIATTAKTSYDDTTVKSGVYYRYTVRAVTGNVRSDFTSGATLMYLKTPAVTASKITGGARVTWIKSAGTSFYYVYRREYSGGKWSKWQRIAKTTKGYNDKTAKKGKEYQYTVRAFNGNYSSTFTPTPIFTR